MLEKKIKIWRNSHGLLSMNYGDREVEIHLKQCFPWSRPGEFLSLRDIDDNEVCLLHSLDDLDESTRKLIEEELSFSQFILNIHKVVKIEEDVELRRYLVQTKQGVRVFQTKLEDWPEVLENGTILIEDLAGDLFRIDDWRELDLESQKELSAYVS
ncbi:MAG: DUF1854 domain-containing protein [Bacteriovoracaceae bacterium]|nr:DUF1854 domain-containing protein [Bacteriovoracaceae bacterium]